MGDSGPTVQRTLVKSPPELWADLSNPETLARRLGEFGEIRITALVPETTVAWEGERASGTVEIEPSGWGTKVRLTAWATAPAIEEDMITEDDLERESALTAAGMTEIEREAAIEAALLAEVKREAEIEAALRAEAEAEAEAEGERQRLAAAAARAAEPAQAEPEAAGRTQAETEPDQPAGPVARERRPGFFARLFRRRSRHERTAATVSAAPDTVPAGADPRPRAAKPAGDRADQSSVPAEPSSLPRPVDPNHRAPVRLAALAFAPAHDVRAQREAKASPDEQPPTVSTEPADQPLTVSTEPADQPPAVSTTTADFDQPGAETITASRHPRSRRPAKPALEDEQTLAVLSGVLDDLGSAHHRPFSRE